jgi:hypothetical protein
MSIKNIKRLYAVVNNTLFKQGKLSYVRLLEALILLCSEVKSTDTDESTWSIGEFEGASLDALIVGAYWFCTDYHGGMNSLEYRALSALSGIFSPGMSGLDVDSSEFMVYEQLEAIHNRA